MAIIIVAGKNNDNLSQYVYFRLNTMCACASLSFTCSFSMYCAYDVCMIRIVQFIKMDDGNEKITHNLNVRGSNRAIAKTNSAFPSEI